MKYTYIPGDDQPAVPVTPAVPSLTSAEGQLVSVERFTRNAITTLEGLCAVAPTPENLEAIETAVTELAPRNDGHHFGVSAAIAQAIAVVSEHDHVRAVRMTETAIEAAEPNTPFEADLIEQWSGLMMSHTEEGRIGIFNHASHTFSAANKPALKTEAAAKVAALSVEAVKPKDADLQGIKRVLGLVADFARSHNNAPLLGLASSHMTTVNNRILFSGPGYGQR